MKRTIPTVELQMKAGQEANREVVTINKISQIYSEKPTHARFGKDILEQKILLEGSSGRRVLDTVRRNMVAVAFEKRGLHRDPASKFRMTLYHSARKLFCPA